MGLPFHREQQFHPVVQVPGHHVRTGQVQFLIAVVGKIVHPAVFQEPPDDGPDGDVFADPFDPGPQAQMPRTIRSIFTPAWDAS